jgi:hypothetical protein
MRGLSLEEQCGLKNRQAEEAAAESAKKPAAEKRKKRTIIRFSISTISPFVVSNFHSDVDDFGHVHEI